MQSLKLYTALFKEQRLINKLISSLYFSFEKQIYLPLLSKSRFLNIIFAIKNLKFNNNNLFQIILNSQKTSYSLHRSKTVSRIKSIMIGIINRIVYVSVKRIKRSHQRIFRREIEYIFNSAIHFKSRFETF